MRHYNRSTFVAFRHKTRTLFACSLACSAFLSLFTIDKIKQCIFVDMRMLLENNVLLSRNFLLDNSVVILAKPYNLVKAFFLFEYCILVKMMTFKVFHTSTNSTAILFIFQGFLFCFAWLPSFSSQFYRLLILYSQNASL